jgi:glycosyltransferase involved in cell wall biosynthesis/SAM-dependent methyltransferase
VDDFSAARQFSYDQIPDWCDFTLWADCDDVIDGAEHLRKIGAKLPPEAVGTMHLYDYARDEHGNPLCELWRERLVRNIPHHLKWKLPVHEVLEVPGQIVPVQEVVWRHLPDPGRPERDPERNLQILLNAYENGDHSPRTLIYIGTEAMTLGKSEQAIDFFKKYEQAETQITDEKCQAFHKLSITLRMDGDERLDEAEEYALKAISIHPDWADGYLDMADISLRRGQWARALQFCEEARQKGQPETMLIINPMEYDFQIRLMRAAALGELGHGDEALAETIKLVEAMPDRDDLRFQAMRLQTMAKTKAAVESILELREVLVRHDENAKAAKLMECIPYFALEDDRIAQARLDQREMTLHLTEPETYAAYYRDNPNEAPFEWTGIKPEDAHENFHRLQFLRDNLQKIADGRSLKDLRVLDLTANDGWMAANLSHFGVGRIDCMDLNAGACARTRARREEYPAIGEVVCDDLHRAPDHLTVHSYDAVILFETIEHVPDPEATMRVLVRMCKKGGRVFVSTPEGAYENGNIPNWDHVEYKGHLRAMPADELARLLAPHGIIEGFALNQGLVVGALRPAPRKGKVVFFAGGAECAPESIVTTGLGGSETALCKMAERFARRGYEVEVYSKTTGLRGDHMSVDADAEMNGQVLYLPAALWDPGDPCDLFVSSRIPEVFDRTIRATHRWLWLHDADYGDFRITPERIARTTGVLVMSEFQRNLLADAYPDALGAANMIVTRNGIEASLYADALPDKKPIVVYTSSPDRGLDVLLDLWPEVVKRVPDAELHFAYAPVYFQFAEQSPPLAAFKKQVDALEAECENVHNHGSLSQPAIADLFRTAKVWAYPSWNSMYDQPFPEISCISAMEAQAAGLVPVTVDYGALKETVKWDRIPLQGGDRWGSEVEAGMVNAIVAALTKPEPIREAATKRVPALQLDWDGVVDQWEGLLADTQGDAPAPVEATA